VHHLKLDFNKPRYPELELELEL